MGGSHVEFDMAVDELLMLEALQEQDNEDDEVYILSSDSENELDNDTINMIIPCIEREANTINIKRKKTELSNVVRTQLVIKCFEVARNFRIPHECHEGNCQSILC